jgi:hypothetical protein
MKMLITFWSVENWRFEVKGLKVLKAELERRITKIS